MYRIRATKNAIKTAINYYHKKARINLQYPTTKMEAIEQKSMDLKNLYLPSIKKRITMPSFFHNANKFIKSHSLLDINLQKDDNKPEYMKQNEEKEKLMSLKLNLTKIDSKIKYMNINCRKLKNERKENIGIIKDVITLDEFHDKENIYKKIKSMLEDIMKNKNLKKKELINDNFENRKISPEEKKVKDGDINMKNNKNKKKKEDEEKIFINVSRINVFNDKDKNNINGKEVKFDDLNNFNEEIKGENEDDKNNNENINKKENNFIDIQGMIEDIKNNMQDEMNVIETASKKSIDINQDLSNLQDFENENMIKINQNNINLNDINNSLEEQMNLKEVNKKEKNKIFNNKEDIDFDKLLLTNKIYNKLKAKSELCLLRHKIINIQEKIKLKDEEIEEIKSKATMKHLIFQSTFLSAQMIKLQKIKIKNDKIGKLSIPKKNIEKGNLKNELDYHAKKNKSFITENKNIEENYIKAKNEFEKNYKDCSKLEIKNDNLKYKYNSLKLKEEKIKIELDNLKKRISQIEDIKLMAENNQSIKGGKKKEIEEAKKLLEQKDKEFERVIKNRDKNYKEMNKLKKQIKIKLNNIQKEIAKKQDELQEIEKNILLEIDKFQHLTKDNIKFINLENIYKTNTKSDFLDKLKEIESEFDKNYEENRLNRFNNLQEGGNIEFYKFAIIKKKPKKIEEIQIEDTSPVFEEKLEYYINSNGELILRSEQKKETEEDKSQKNIIEYY